MLVTVAVPVLNGTGSHADCACDACHMLVQEKSKAEQAEVMMHNSSDSCARQLSQLHKELRTSRQEGQLLQGQLETALGQLQRKREKKRHYKAALLEETEQLQAALVHKDVRIGELNHRVDKVSLMQALAMHDISSDSTVLHGCQARGVPRWTACAWHAEGHWHRKCQVRSRA